MSEKPDYKSGSESQSQTCVGQCSGVNLESNNQTNGPVQGEVEDI